MIDLSIVIVSFNTKELLSDLLSSIKSTVKKHSYEIIVVDNVSTDGTQDALKNWEKSNKHLSIILNTENEGFSKANNRGVKKASGKYVLFLNPDMVMYDKTIDGMLSYMEDNPQTGAATCFLQLPNGKLDDAAHRGFPTPWNSLTHFSGLAKVFPKSKILSGYSKGYEDIEKPHEIDALAGAFMLVSKKAGDHVGWWDEDFFWYGEDLDFCYRLKKKGYKIMYVPEFKALHYKGASGGIKKSTSNLTKADSNTRKKAQNARFDAMKIFYNKHYKDKYPTWLTSLVLKGIDIRFFLSRLQ